MGKRFIIDVDYDEEHILERAGYENAVVKAQVTPEVLQNLLTVLESSTTESYEEALSGEGEKFGPILWIVAGVLCFILGAVIGGYVYVKGGMCLIVDDFLRRYCPRYVRSSVSSDPILLSVVERQSKDSVKEKDGDKDSKDEEKDKVDGEEQNEESKTKAEDVVQSPEKNAEEGEKAEDENTEDRKTSSSSSSSSEGEDEEGSVRQRKKGTAPAQETEEVEAAQEAEEKSCEEHHEE